MTSIAGFTAETTTVVVGGERIVLWRVADPERYVDRRALLAAEDPPEPPYWTYLWSGAGVLAAAVPGGVATALELGCGLGLPGLVAARRGARVTFVDRMPAPLGFVRASAQANALDGVGVVAADFARLPLRAHFDLVLAAEVLYERTAFGALVRTIDAALAPGGRALLADAGRIDTGGFYAALAEAGLAARVTEHPVREEGLPVTVRVVDIRRR